MENIKEIIDEIKTKLKSKFQTTNLSDTQTKLNILTVDDSKTQRKFLINRLTKHELFNNEGRT